MPTKLDIPQLAPKLGKGWRDLDVEEVGEEWLSALLSLRLDPTEWRPAADGWDGGLYRAWADDHGHVAVVLKTAWDTSRDAAEFDNAMSDWIHPGTPAGIDRGGRQVIVVFASDRATARRVELLVGFNF